ncbi:SLC13 family permease [Variovorax ureilyticus]|uniref:SLC13 family permease n=1 Tax=Variovorax ureilyticus TaxID=1836198 RepID=A0ABU8VE09_9BURK
MTVQLGLVLLLLAAAIAMFALNRPRTDAVALIMMASLPFTGVVTMQEVLAGFADPNVVLIAMLFVIGQGLVRTGVARRLGDMLVTRAGSNETRLVVMLMVIVALVGSIMSSTAVVAIFIPIVLRIAHNTGLAPGRLMMPLCVAALVSGTLTLVATTPNLVIHGELVREGFAGFGFFSITPFGLPLLAVAIVYMLLARSWLGRSPASSAAPPSQRTGLGEWIEEYGLAGREHRFEVSADSLLAGKTLEELALEPLPGVNLLAVERRTRFATHLLPPSTRIQAGDVLFVDVSNPEIDTDGLTRRFGVSRLPLAGAYFSEHAQDIGMAEVMIPPGSALVGKTIPEARLRDAHDVSVIGLRHGSGESVDGPRPERLEAGDTLLVVGLWKAISKLRSDMDLVVFNLPSEFDDIAPAASRAPFALLSLALVVALMVSGVLPNVHAALIGCLLMGLFGCIDLPSAYRSVHWQSLLLIVGMLPFSLALQRTGGVDIAAQTLVDAIGEAGPRTVLAAVFIVTALLGMFISNTATAVLMAPVAIAIAQQLNASPLPFAMIVALASSAAFTTPVSSPVNTLVVGPGDYSFMDFVRVGVPLVLLTLLLSIALVPWLLPL